MYQKSHTDEVSLVERRKQLPAILVLLLNTGLMWFGFFMLIPLVALHATRDLGVSAALAGMVLAVRQFVQQGLGVFIAAIADWFGYRRMMLCGLLIRVVGFSYLAFAPDLFHLMLSGVVAGIGGACFDSSGKAALAAISRGYNRETIFSWTATVGNIGMTTGPLLGVALLRFDFKVVGLASATIYLGCAVLLLLFVPFIPPASVHTAQHYGAAQVFGQLGLVWQNRPFLILNLMMAGYYILYVQINITLPLLTVKLTGSEGDIALIYGVSSGLAIAFQYISVKVLRHWFQPVTIIGLGTGLAGLGLFGVAFANNLASLLGCVVVYSLGRLVVEPMTYIITAQYATNETMASYFGFSALALALGSICGNLLGGWLFDLGNHTGLIGLCWLTFGAISLLIVVGIFWFQSYQARHSSNFILINEKVATHLPD
ncbi:MAG: MFS transporter [Chloroflexi bacterium]|nr:MFS transporter [Chloroflexota bacterium]